MSVEIYTKPSCGYCLQAKALLNRSNVQFKEYNLGTDATKEDIQRRVNALGYTHEIRTVPQIFYTDKNGQTHYIGGYTDLVAKQQLLNT